MHKHIILLNNSSRVIWLIKWNKLCFLNIKINKPLPTPVCIVSSVRFKFRDQLYLLWKIRILITFRVESINININSSITNNIQMIMNVKRGGISRDLLWRLPSQNYLKLSITENLRNKVKYKMWNSKSLEFTNRTSRPNSVESSEYIHSFYLNSPRFVNNTDSSVRYNCLKACSWKKVMLLNLINKPIMNIQRLVGSKFQRLY